ncbi:MAG TPA: IscS subfamily cysteine desulfurase [Vicinamibacterales bacterium]|nr:IscS subfamily cysteine desulfurase [Vicinamibacterales bacterium]
MARIYMDHNATTPVASEVAERMDRAVRDLWGNASSVHHFGQQAKAAVDDARGQVASLLGAAAAEVVFTAGGTESDNFAIRGAAEALESTGRRHLIATSIEHEAVLRTFAALAKRGWRVTLLPVDASGIVSPEALSDAITDDTALVSVMHANNEIGTVQPLGQLAEIARAHGAVVHTDAVQSASKIPIDVSALGVDLLSISAHKLYGPKGVGALWLRKGLRLTPFMTGGRQERNRRAGTENVPGIVGLGAAAERGQARMHAEAARVSALRDRLETGLLTRVAGAARNGAVEPRVPNTTNISFDRIESESLLIGLDLEGIAVSSGSACSSGTLEPSHVLKAMGLPHLRTLSSIRFSLGAGNTEADVDRVITVLPPLVDKLRSLTAVSGRR